MKEDASRRFKFLTPPEEVVNKVLSQLSIRVEVETVKLDLAIDRICAEDIYAHRDIPPYNRAVLDGYATLYSSIEKSSTLSPSRLKIKGKTEVDHPPPRKELEIGDAWEVSTGAALPPNAEVVIPYEYTKRTNDEVLVFKEFPPGYGISRKGEDLKKGELIIRKGEVIKPWHIALLASQGLSSVKVYRKIKASIVSIGSELVEPGSELRVGLIYDTTRYLIKTYLIKMGLDIKDLGIISDNINEIRETLSKALNESTIVFTIGGTSIGKKDYTIRAVKELKPTLLIHGFALKPGRPGAIAVFNTDKMVMCLSGFPVAALAEVEAIFKPIYMKILGITKPLNPKLKAKAARKIPSEPGIMEIYRVIVCSKDKEYFVYPLKLTGSGIISTLIKANALLIIPPDVTGYSKGDIVEVELIGEVSECRE